MSQNLKVTWDGVCCSGFWHVLTLGHRNYRCVVDYQLLSELQDYVSQSLGLTH